MDRNFAIMVLNSCYRACKDLGEVGVMVKEFSSESDGINIKEKIGLSIAEIGAIITYIYEVVPDLEAYVEERIEKYGRLS